MKKIRVLGLILGIIIFLFGFIGFISSISFSNATEKFYEIKTVSERNGIVVDTHGNIYIGDGQNSTIQVFSNNGLFLYGFTLSTSGGTFNFGIDENDVIHVITERNDLHLMFKNGDLINQEEVTYEEKQELKQMYNIPDNDLFTIWTTGSIYKTETKEYKITFSKNLVITDLSTNNNQVIELGIPKWPFSVFSFWIISALGLGLIFWSYGWKMIKNAIDSRKKVLFK